MIVEQYIDPAGFTRTLWRMANGVDIWHKSLTTPTLLQLQNHETAYMSNTEYDGERKVVISILEEIHVMVKIVKQIKDNPSLTLTQYNNYLGTLPWNEAATIRFMIYMLGKKLAEIGQIAITQSTEQHFLAQVRNWVVATPSRKIGKMIFGEFRSEF